MAVLNSHVAKAIKNKITELKNKDLTFSNTTKHDCQCASESPLAKRQQGKTVARKQSQSHSCLFVQLFILVYMKVRMLDFISLLVQYFASGFKDLEAANLCFPAQ